MASDKTLRLYNTLTRRVETVEPLEAGHLRFYACGPTVYSYAHIGNFRSFLTADLLLRTARALGWKTTYVTNITDVGHLSEDDYTDPGGEDRMLKALRSKEGEAFANIWDLARYYTDALLNDWHVLNLREPDVRPRATDHVAQQIRAVEALLARGHAYETDQGIYFSVPSFPDYGKLSGNVTADELAQGVRDVVQDEGKRDPRDFALWKKDDQHLMQWHSPWGWGFPGWHIECSAMSMHYLGDTFDIHTGGEDNKFPHHECEIAQAESLTGRPFVKYWVHTRHLQVEGEKMAKSKGNFYTVRELTLPEAEGGRGVNPLALRYALISGKYREPYNFTLAQLKAATKHVERFQNVAARIEEAEADSSGGDPDEALTARLEKNYAAVLRAMLDDLNTPRALAAALGGVKMLENTTLDSATAGAAAEWLDGINALLGIVRHETAPATLEADDAPDPLAEQVEALLSERTAARQNKDYARADAIRDELDALGVEVMDTADGTTWRRKLTV